MAGKQHQPLSTRGEDARACRGRRVGGRDRLGLLVGEQGRVAVSRGPQEATKPLPENPRERRMTVTVDIVDRAANERRGPAMVTSQAGGLRRAADQRHLVLGHASGCGGELIPELGPALVVNPRLAEPGTAFGG